MNIQDIKTAIDYIKQKSGDDETAHVLEDQLRAQFIAAIANRTFEDDITTAACAILTTDSISFARWCA